MIRMQVPHCAAPSHAVTLAHVLTIGCVWFLPVPVRAVNVALLFNTPFGSDTNQSLSGTTGIAPGSAMQVGGTVIGLNIPNQTLPLSSRPVSLASQPSSSDNRGDCDLGDTGANRLVDINSLNLELLNGQTALAIANQVLTTSGPLLFLGPFGETLTHFTFTQTGPSFITGGSTTSGGTGSFSVPGSIAVQLNSGFLPAGLAPSTMLTSITLSNESVAFPFTLTGGWSVSPLGPGERKVSLDGNQTIGIPLSVTGQLLIPLDAVTVTVAVNGSVQVAFTYHLEVTAIPEPASIALLGLGLMTLLPAVHRRRKGRRQAASRFTAA